MVNQDEYINVPYMTCDIVNQKCLSADIWFRSIGPFKPMTHTTVLCDCLN